MYDDPRAEPLVRQAVTITLRHLDNSANALTEQQQITMNQSVRHRLDNYIACALAMAPEPTNVVEQLVAWKGAVLVRGRGMRLAASDPAIAGQFEQLRSITQRLSAMTLNVPEPERLETWRSQLDELQRQKDRLEADLMRSSSTFREANRKVTFDEVRQAIPADGVLVDFFEYGRGDGRRIVASIVRRDAEPVMLDLGSATEAEEAIRVWRRTLGADVAARRAGAGLRDQSGSH